jgi:serine/threonine protein kinase
VTTPGRRSVSHYKILEQLGGGGMGIVYKAHDLKHGRLVALKFLPPGLTRNPELKRRFMREAQTAATLEHPALAVVHDICETDEGQVYIVMAFYDGETLKKKLSRGGLAVATALGTTSQIARGLAKAHKSGIVHRDIKPANIMMTPDWTPKVLDFGFATLAARPVLKKGSAANATHCYLSPEQIRNEEADPRSDIWSLGVVLYEMLTGKRPFDAADAGELRYKILNSPSPRPSVANSDVPDEIDEVVIKALRKDPRERYQKADEFAETLESTTYLINAGAWQSASRRFFTPFVRFQRRTVGSPVVTLVLIGLLALLAVLWWVVYK